MMNPIKKKKISLIFTFFNLKQQFLLDSIVIKYLHNPISVKCCVMLQKTQMCAYLTRGK